MAGGVEGIDLDHVLAALGRRISPEIRTWIDNTMPMATSHLNMVRIFIDHGPDVDAQWDALFATVYRGALASRVYGAGPEGDGRAIPSAIIQACKAVLLPTLIDEGVDDAQSDEGIDSVEAVDIVIDDRVADAIIALEARRLVVDKEEPSTIDGIRAMAKVMRTIVSFRLTTTVPDGWLASMIETMSWIALDMATAPNDPDWLEDRAKSIADALGLCLPDEPEESQQTQPEADRVDRLHARIATMLARSPSNPKEDAAAAASIGVDVLRMAAMGAVLGMPHLGNLPSVVRAEARWLEMRSAESDGATEAALARAIVPYAIAALAIVDRINPKSLTPESMGHMVEDVRIELLASFDDLLLSDQPLLAACAVIEEILLEHAEQGDEDEPVAPFVEITRDEFDAWASTSDALGMVDTIAAADDVAPDETPGESDLVDPIGWVVLHVDGAKILRRVSSAFDALGAPAGERRPMPGGSHWRAQDVERSFGRMRSDARRLAKASGGIAIALLDDRTSVLAMVEGGGQSRFVHMDHVL